MQLEQIKDVTDELRTTLNRVPSIESIRARVEETIEEHGFPAVTGRLFDIVLTRDGDVTVQAQNPKR